jgi:hypothetical protein
MSLTEYNSDQIEAWTNNLACLLVLTKGGFIEGDADQQTSFIQKKFWEHYMENRNNELDL